MAAPMDVLEKITGPSEARDLHIARGVKEGGMVLFFMDVKNNLMVLEIHMPPSSLPYTSGEKMPDEHWKIHTIYKLNGNLPDSDTE